MKYQGLRNLWEGIGVKRQQKETSFSVTVLLISYWPGLVYFLRMSTQFLTTPIIGKVYCIYYYAHWWAAHRPLIINTKVLQKFLSSIGYFLKTVWKMSRKAYVVWFFHNHSLFYKNRRQKSERIKRKFDNRTTIRGITSTKTKNNAKLADDQVLVDALYLPNSRR